MIPIERSADVCTCIVIRRTASRGPNGYNAFQPNNDNDIIAPTAALSAMPFIPRESMSALKYYYHVLGNRLWGDFGFRDAFNCHV